MVGHDATGVFRKGHRRRERSPRQEDDLRFDPWVWPQPQAPNTFSNMNATRPGIMPLSAERLLDSCYVQQDSKVEGGMTETIELPNKLPSSMWTLLSYSLGVAPGEATLKPAQRRVSIGLHILTLIAAFCFGGCGLIYNVYESLSRNTKIFILETVFKCIMGVFWMLLGIYSHSLAARLFSLKGILNYIRLHSKTFLKISTFGIVSFLAVVVVATNLYSNVFLLNNVQGNDTMGQENTSCDTIGLRIELCLVFFISKVVFCCLSLVWNLIVVAVCLSVCNTHSISIRRFLMELSYDSKIFEEVVMQSPKSESYERQSSDYVMVYDEDFMRMERDFIKNNAETSRLKKQKEMYHSCVVRRLNSRQLSRDERMSKSNSMDTVQEEAENIEVFPEIEEQPRMHGNRGTSVQMDLDGEANGTLNSPTFDAIPAPLITNEDLLLTYFQMMKHLRSTSRLMQRWMTSWITFVLMWCGLFLIHWISHNSTVAGVIEFMVPLIVLGLLASAYSEVNFEGGRLPSFILPTERRMSVLYYITNVPLELKIYSLPMTYNVIVTAIAGISLTLLTRIAFDNML